MPVTSPVPLRHENARTLRGSRERGLSVTTLVAGVFPMMLLCAGLAVDGSERAHASRHVSVAAAQAARAGSDAAAAERLTGGSGVGQAQAAARRSLADHGVSGTATYRDGRLRVEATQTVNTTFLTLIGVHQLHVHAEAEAELTRP